MKFNCCSDRTTIYIFETLLGHISSHGRSFQALESNAPFILNQTVVAKSREIQLNHNISYEHPSICDEKSGSHHPSLLLYNTTQALKRATNQPNSLIFRSDSPYLYIHQRDRAERVYEISKF